MRRVAPLIIAVLLFGAERTFGAEETILLEQSQIVGGGAPIKEDSRGGIPGERPALSTSLPWGAPREEHDLNIAQEIFNRLAEPDPSYLSMENLEDFESPKVESMRGE
jgi:hypothetical protein